MHLKESLGDMPVVVIHADKQPSVAITIQTEYSYFSAINLSFLTHGNQSDCSQCINRQPSHTAVMLWHFKLIIDPCGQGVLESSLSV